MQGLQGFCWAFAFCAHLETQLFINSGGKGQLQELSVEQIVHCSYTRYEEGGTYFLPLPLVLCNNKDKESCTEIDTTDGGAFINCGDFSYFYDMLESWYDYDSMVKSPTIGVLIKRIIIQMT